MNAEIVTLDPTELARFIAELGAGGFTESDDDGRRFEGPLPTSLTQFTDSTRMSIFIHDGWPYVQPSVIVLGIDWWHAGHQAPCLWQADDNTKQWLTLDGIFRRLDEWALHAARGFDSIQGAALDPQMYFDSYSAQPIGIDEAALLCGLQQNGQHHAIRVVEGQDGMLCIEAGKCPPGGLSGRWFYRDTVRTPPKSLDDFVASLTDKQRELFNATMRRDSRGLFVLIWPTPHGVASLILYVTESGGRRKALAATPTPTSQSDRLRRAGPDADVLRTKRIVIFGLGAIGSHVGALLARSGAGFLRVVDGDFMTPVVLVRHAATRVDVAKVGAFTELIQRFDWTKVEPVERSTRHPGELAELINGCDLCIDATGSSLFAELLSRVAEASGVPMVSVALYRGGSIVRVRRQIDADQSIVSRNGHWRYPAIPPNSNIEDDYVGTETGCTAPIHNAPPTAVMTAAALGTTVAVDLLTCRYEYPDEVIEVLSPIEPPFTDLGRFKPSPPTVLVTDEARATMIAAAARSHPNETGGVLVGLTDATGAPCVMHALELPPTVAVTSQYTVPRGATATAIDEARSQDARIGYLGEWHSHPTDQPASATDAASMRNLAAISDTSQPILFVLRPIGATFRIDAYVTIDGLIRPTRTIAVGPLEMETA